MSGLYEIPFSALKNKPLETRIYALVVLYEATERLQAFNDENKREVNDKVYDALISFTEGVMGESEVSTDEENVIETFPELMEIVSAKSREEQRNIARDFLAKHQELAFTDHHRVELIGKGNCDIVKPKTFEEINAIILDDVQSRKSPYGTKDIAQNITEENFDNDAEKINFTYKKLLQQKKKITERLIADWFSYKRSNSDKLEILEGVMAKIVDHISVAYKVDFDKVKGDTKEERNANLHPLQKANRRVRAYFSASSKRQYNKDFPQTKVKCEDYSKDKFLKIIGTFMHCGQNQYFSHTKDIQIDYSKLKIEVKKLYPDNYDEALNRILGVNPKNMDQIELEKTRQANFEKKSREVYIKSLCAGLKAKDESSKGNFDAGIFIKDLMPGYIRDMKDTGENNVLYLATIKEDAKSWKDVSDARQEELQSMIATVHHHRPIASTIDFYVKMHPEVIQANQTLVNMPEEKLLNLADKVQEYANNLGNHCLVFGSGTHDLLEAKGYYEISDKKESTVIAAIYDYKKIIDLVRQTDIDKSIKDELCKDIEKYGKSKDKNGIIRCEIDFPDHPEVEKLQQSLYNDDRNTVDSTSLSKALIQYAKRQK